MINYANKLKVILNNFEIDYLVSSLENEFLVNPNHNNFFGLSQILRKYGLKTTAKKIDFDESSSLRKPFIVQVTEPAEICTVSSINNEYVTGIDENGMAFRYARETFSKRWSGYVMEPELISDVKKGIYFNNFLNIIISNKEVFIFIFLVLSFINALRFEEHVLSSSALFFSSLTGLYISYQLLKLKVSTNQNKFCKIIKNGDCASIINSTKFLNVIDYDKVGIVYFLFLTLIPVISSYKETGTTLLIISSISALFPFYSIYYQKFIMKTWCTLCLVVQILLLFNLVILSLKVDFNLIHFSGISEVLVVFVLAVILGGYYFQSNSLNMKYTTTQRRLNEFIKNEDVFEFLRQKNVEYLDIPVSSKILIGVENENEITFVTNPFCRYCESAYKAIKDLALVNQSFRLNIIYLAGSNEISIQICKQLFSIYFNKGENAYLEAVDQWYTWGYKNYSVWQETFLEDGDFDYEEKFGHHKTWILDHKITSTPSVLINNRLIPKEYEISDLNYF